MHGQRNIKLLLLCKVFHQGEMCWSWSRDEFLARFQSGEKRLLAPSCLPVRLSAQNNSAVWTDFYEMRLFEYFSKIRRENSSFTKIWQELLCSALRQYEYPFMVISRSVLRRMKNVSEKICRENWNTCLTLNDLFSRKSYRLCDNAE
jgi:hypothetical protein